MKKIKLSIICTAALLLALPFAGCMHADSGDTATQGTTQLTQEVKDEKTAEDDCPDGECPGDGDCDDKDDKCPDGRCPKDGGDCPDGKCPKRKFPHHRRGKHRKAVTLPCPICGDNN
ncbi:MAG: hypothetical protein K2H78_03350 [Clostridia bacterium]|nr:hypothetical protein [Clostridia bacterium]